MAKVKAQVQENQPSSSKICNNDYCAKLSEPKEFSKENAIEELHQNFLLIEKHSENILVAIQHLEAVQKLLLKEAVGIEVVDSEIVK